MKKALLTILQYVIFLGLGILLIWWQSSKLDPSDKAQMMTAFSQVRERIWLILPVILIGFLSHLFRALRWKLLLEPLNLRPTTANITFAVLIGYLVNLLVPRMGEVARCTVLAKYEHEPADKIVGTIVAERSFDLVCLMLVALLTFLLQINVVSNYLSELWLRMAVKGSTLALSIGGFMFFIALLIFIYKKNKASKVGMFIKGIGDGVMSIMHMQHRGRFLVYTLLIWICYLSLVFIGFQSMEATEDLRLFPALSVLVFGSLGMIVTPGGLGAYPIAVQEVLMKLYDVKDSYALAFGWVSWLAQTSIVVVLGLLSLILLPLYNTRKHGQDTVDTK